jgi:hypothetical protein
MKGALLLAAVLLAGQNAGSAVSPMVVDSANQQVGEVIGGDLFRPLVMFRVNSQPFVVLVSRTAFLSADYPVYTTSNCTGQPYFNAYDQNEVMYPHAAAFRDTQTSPFLYFLEDFSSPIVTLTVRSYRYPGGCSTTSWTAQVRRADDVTHAFPLFQPPFSIQ